MFLAYCFLRDIHEGYSSLEDSVEEQSNFASKLNNFLDKGKKIIEKEFFINNLGLLFSAREKLLNNFRNRLFPIKHLDRIPTCEPSRESTPELATEPTKYKKSN